SSSSAQTDPDAPGTAVGSDQPAADPADPPADPASGSETPNSGQQALGQEEQPTPPPAPQTDLGVRLQPAAEGLIVAEVTPGGLFARAGARPGDQIVLVGDLRVSDQ